MALYNIWNITMTKCLSTSTVIQTYEDSCVFVLELKQVNSVPEGLTARGFCKFLHCGTNGGTSHLFGLWTRFKGAVPVSVAVIKSHLSSRPNLPYLSLMTVSDGNSPRASDMLGSENSLEMIDWVSFGRLRLVSCSLYLSPLCHTLLNDFSMPKKQTNKQKLQGLFLFR